MQPTSGSVQLPFSFPALQHNSGTARAWIVAAHHMETKELPNSPQEENEQRHLYKKKGFFSLKGQTLDDACPCFLLTSFAIFSLLPSCLAVTLSKEGMALAQ